MVSWSCLCPSELDVNGTELVRSPRSALAIFRCGTRVRDLCDTDLRAIHRASRKSKLVGSETAKRIELDRSRRDILRHDVLNLYRSICRSFSRDEVVCAVRRFIFKGQDPDEGRRLRLRHKAKTHQHLRGHDDDDDDDEDDEVEEDRFNEEMKTKAFSNFTCSPSREARALLREEEVSTIITKRNVDFFLVSSFCFSCC